MPERLINELLFQKWDLIFYSLELCIQVVLIIYIIIFSDCVTSDFAVMRYKAKRI